MAIDCPPIPRVTGPRSGVLNLHGYRLPVAYRKLDKLRHRHRHRVPARAIPVLITVPPPGGDSIITTISRPRSQRCFPDGMSGELSARFGCGQAPNVEHVVGLK